jgi:hypothetical protein
MSSNQKITDPAALEARRIRKAEVRRQYDESRKLDHYMLSVYVPKAWKEEGLGVAVRELIFAHIAVQRAAGKRKVSIVKTLKEEVTRLQATGGGRD